MPATSLPLSERPALRSLVQDGRQSERALAIRRGVCRRLRAERYALIPELTLSSGRRADLVAICPAGSILIIEIKSSVEDFRADQKWPDYLRHADALYFATAPDVPPNIFPESAGLIVADPYGAEILRECGRQKLPPATRREMLIRIARAGAMRLHDLEDPEAVFGGS
ncbi:MmcB family DNA repair protein [Faunimonas sp. B44]|uniref:MmcB family DNA repair protein n=1 Tax=Faunimonas sp. B44 TaxID=3461493 RepID=UPI0040449054